MAESALENIRRTISRRNQALQKGRMLEGARGYQYKKTDIMQELHELSKIKNMDSASNKTGMQVGIVNIRCKGESLASKSNDIVNPKGKNRTFSTCRLNGNKENTKVTYMPIGLVSDL